MTMEPYDLVKGLRVTRNYTREPIPEADGPIRYPVKEYLSEQGLLWPASDTIF